MDSARWEKIQAVFHEAASRPESERQGFLAACGADAETLAEVRAMLQADGGNTSLLDRGLPEVAYGVLGAPLESFPCEQVGPYRLTKILGQGGMGVVYLAGREDTAAPVAIKFLLHAGMSAPRRDSFAREIKTLAKLKHPFIARLYDAGSLADGTPWFVMEYVEGVPLCDYCRDKKLAVVERLWLFRAVCEAVQYAYRQGIIHRDLKPSNILVEKDGTPRLLDFGVARQLQSREDAAPEPPSALRFGSPAYAPPEWIHDGTVGAYSDVYSLGVILYEMLAGRLPDGAFDTLRPSSRDKADWSDLNALCRKAMHPDAQHRYQSVEELLRDIDHYLRCEPLEARPAAVKYRARKFAKRHRRAAMAASLMTALIAGLVVFYTVRLTKAKNAAVAEAARTQRVEEFMENLFEGGDQEVGPSADLKVVTLLDRGVQKLRVLNGDPKVQAHLYQTLGTVYQSLGMLDQADSLMQASIARLKSVYGPDHEEIAHDLLQLAMLRIDQARLPEAEVLARQTLAMDQRHLPAGSVAIAEATATLGDVLERRGQYEKAIGVLTDAVRLLETAGAPKTDISGARTLLANAHYHLGHYAISDSLNREILAMDQQLHGPRHPDVADDFLNLANIQSDWGHYPEAESYYRQGLDIYRSWYGEKHPSTADIRSYLAQALIAEQRYDEAEPLAKQAFDALDKAFPKTPDPRLAMALRQLGAVAQHRGALRDAEADYSRAASIYQAVYGDQHQTTAIALSNLAGVYLDEGQSARAERLLRDAVQRLSRGLPAGHRNIGVARIRLGRVLLREKRYQEAEAETLAGYTILTSQTGAAPVWLQVARQDLAAIYTALHQPDKAAPFAAPHT